MTLTELHLGGVFEDRAQCDYLRSLVTVQGARLGYEVTFHEARLTHGCRIDALRQHLQELSPHYVGLVVGVDGRKTEPVEKAKRLQGAVGECWRGPFGAPRVLWAVASPSIEAWMMADPDGVRGFLGAYYGVPVKAGPPPEPPRAEQRARLVLDAWVHELLGAPLRQGGREHAQEFAAALRIERVARSRHPELVELVSTDLPDFLQAAARGA